MKARLLTPGAFAALTMLVTAGCAAGGSAPAADRAPAHPPGTNVGTSNPGVNQGTQFTTATRSTDS